MSKKADLHNTIRVRALAYAKQLKEGTTTARIGLARCVLSLAEAEDELGDNGRRGYEKATHTVLSWVGDGSEDIGENMLNQARYVAMRMSDRQIAVLLKAGASFSNIYDSTVELVKKGKPIARYIVKVKRGEADVRAHSRDRRATSFYLTSERRKVARRLQSMHGVNVNQVPIVLTFSDEELQNRLDSIIAAAVSRGLNVDAMIESAKERVAKMKLRRTE